jgi:DNA-binding NarL/FixJ family response regulator
LPARGEPRQIELMIVCRAELMLLGLERLLVQAPDLTVFTYTGVPANPPAAAPGDGDHGPVGGQLPRVALVSDRRARDAVGDIERLREGVADEVVLLSSRPDISVLLGAIGAGANAFVMEGDPPEVLVAAVRSAAVGRTYMGQRTLELLVDWLAQRERTPVSRAARARDEQLLRLLAEGRSTADIAGHLGIAPKTVRNRSSDLYHRLGVRSRAAAVRLAEERGLLDGSP